MTPTITYNGVESAQGGTIFKDVKFWVAQRVPIRNNLLNMIKQNQGIVVPLERQADILIADDAKQRLALAPPGSYSWKFITESVDNGIIQLKDRYLIGRDPELPRPVGGNHLAKSTRTPYTGADDAKLARWVLAHRGDRQGNAIYQEFEKSNPRHTWQSWRDRYIKKLQPKGMDALERLAASAPEEPDEGVAVPEQTPVGASSRATTEKRPRNAAQEPPRREPKRSRNNLPRPEQEPGRTPKTPPQAGIAEASQDQPPAEGTHSKQDPELAARRQVFYEDLEEFIVASGAEIERRIDINGKTIDLFDLAIAVNTFQIDQESQMADWYKVAENLGFENPDEDTANQLLMCHDKNLMDFLLVMADFREEEEAEEEGEDGDDEVVEVMATEHSESRLNNPDRDAMDESGREQASSQWPQGYVPSSPPVAAAGLKRSADQRPFSSSGPATKRMRFRRDMEIPSTPDADLGSQLPAPQQASPSARHGAQWQDYVDESEASQQLPPLPPAQDESQDLGTELPSPRPAVRQHSVGATLPRQHHQHETLDATPIPFSLRKQRQQQKPINITQQPHPIDFTGPSLHIDLTEPSRPQRQESRAESSRARRGSSSREGSSIQTATTAVKTKPTAKSSAARRSLPASFTSSRSSRPRQSATAEPPRSRTREPTSQSQRSHDSHRSNRRAIQDWIAHYESMGFPRSTVIEGLQRTTLTPGSLAQLVMEYLNEGRGVPSHHEGIWTDRDDADLDFASAIDLNHAPSDPAEQRQRRRAQKAHDRLIQKHGVARVDLRKAFLDAQTVDSSDHPRG
ncbi:hypothetical protein ACJ41O_008530 [Fusarium nematophilum]